MRRSQSIGLAHTRLQHIDTAAAFNVTRIVAWLNGNELAPTLVCAFQRLSYGEAIRRHVTLSLNSPYPGSVRHAVCGSSRVS